MMNRYYCETCSRGTVSSVCPVCDRPQMSIRIPVRDHEGLRDTLAKLPTFADTGEAITGGEKAYYNDPCGYTQGLDIQYLCAYTDGSIPSVVRGLWHIDIYSTEAAAFAAKEIEHGRSETDVAGDQDPGSSDAGPVGVDRSAPPRQ